MQLMIFEVFNITFLFVIIVFYISTLLSNRNLIEFNREIKRQITFEILIALSLGFFIPFFTSFYFLLLSLKTYSMLIIPFRKNKEYTEYFCGLNIIQKFWMIISSIFTQLLLIIFVILYLIGAIGRFFSNDPFYPINFLLGGISVLIILVYYKQKDEKHIYEIYFKITPKTFKVVIIVAVIISTIYLTGIYNNLLKKNSSIIETYNVKYITYNILNSGADGNENNWDERKEYLAEFLFNQDPDIFGLQEAYQIQVDYIDSIMINRNYSIYGVGRNNGVKSGEQCAIFYDSDKYILLEKGTFWFSNTPNIPSKTFMESNYRICSWVHLRNKKSGGEFFVYNTHYGFMPWHQILASILINNHVSRNTEDLPVIVNGDFNMINFYPFYLYMEGFGKKPLYDAYRMTHGIVNPFKNTNTITDNINFDIGFHIDHFFISENINVNNCTIYKDSFDGIHQFSDHYPVVMDCEIPIV